MICFGVWAPSRQVFWDTWVEAGICSEPGVFLPPYTNCVDTTDTSWDGVVYKDGQAVPGWHCNVRVYGDLEELMRQGKPQITPEGDALPIWQATRAQDFFQLTFQPADALTGFPAGYRSQSGVTYADVRDFSSPSNVFA